MPSGNRSAAFIERIPAPALVLVDPLFVEVHLPAAVRTDDFALKEVDERRAYLFGFLHFCLSFRRGGFQYVLYLLKVLAGDDRLVCVREYNPLILVLDFMGTNTFIQRPQRTTKNGISDIVRICKDFRKRRTVPAVPGIAVSLSGAVHPFLILRCGSAHALKRVQYVDIGFSFELPPEYQPHILGSLFVDNHIAVFLIPLVTIGQISFDKGSVLHLSFQRCGDFS